MKQKLEQLISNYKQGVGELSEEAELKMLDYREAIGRKEELEAVLIDLEELLTKIK